LVDRDAGDNRNDRNAKSISEIADEVCIVERVDVVSGGGVVNVQRVLEVEVSKSFEYHADEVYRLVNPPPPPDVNKLGVVFDLPEVFRGGRRGVFTPLKI
jgi:hypothetical protein